ncbi:MAG: TatD family hydrolase [Gomphosphaeria aponina SAG 52.96 = DSM 107014]|uniref:D-aminoacyl-tRNA deacylase n=1 Tax=Gomphosphaeria aponina SAG 52.96 = DSM 107014 TaxID=1521640 RepID=A0A941GUR8_9CHRO|nr:TatD family hydrolase [Gomphosphaeria aponina SAG 52.96 = DSM 107014]
MELIDTHVHLNDKIFEGELNWLREHWQAAGVTKLVHSCVCPEEFESIRAIANQFPEVYFAVGLHPLDAQKWTGETKEEILRKGAADERVVALGEMGLDYYKAENKELQKEILKAQLEVAKELDLPVIIHCREAAAELREICQEFWEKSGAVSGVMHCWGGTPAETQWFLDLGFYISFSGIVTFKNAKTVKESAQMVPSDRLLIETDCPYLAPVPKRGKRNEPANVKYVAECLAELRNVSEETIAQETTANACLLFGI